MSAPRSILAARACRRSCPRREAFEGLLPSPVVAAPSFAIRKPAVAVFTLGTTPRRWHHDGRPDRLLRWPLWTAEHPRRRRHSTGRRPLPMRCSPKWPEDFRLGVLIEGTRELQCRAANLVALRTKDGVASLSDLVRSSLRLQPDRIPVGEVRGAEALDLLRPGAPVIRRHRYHPAGTPGGCCARTDHPGSRRHRAARLIAETIDVIAFCRAQACRRLD